MHLCCFCFRRRALQRKVQESQIPVEEKEEMMRNLERRETEYMRIQRRKIGIDDFEQLTVIGKGAFGEVCKYNLDKHLVPSEGVVTDTFEKI